MTLDRDVRLTADQIIYTAEAIKKQRRQLGRAIAAAEANLRAGATIQRGTHERNVEKLHELGKVLEVLEVVRKAIAQKIADQVTR